MTDLYGATGAITLAAAAVAGGYTAPGWYIVHGDAASWGGTQMQEFITNSGSFDHPPVPEPASILLLGVVLFGCGRGLARRWS